MKDQHIRQLTLDLRDNQGGDFEPARYLLSYLVLRPTQFLLDGEQARLVSPQANHFTGKLVVLMNGGCFSATGILLAILEREHRAVLVGEEAGGNKYVISGEAEEEELPETKIRCFISTKTFRITEGVNDGHGVLPGKLDFKP